jgi:hypothetical protein
MRLVVELRNAKNQTFLLCLFVWMSRATLFNLCFNPFHSFFAATPVALQEMVTI